MKTLTALISLFITVHVQAKGSSPLVDIKSLFPEIKVEAKYFGNDNFIGEKIDGYEASKCLLSKAAAKSLGRAQQLAENKGLGLMVFDCYRPQVAVDHFVRWAGDLEDTRRKSVHYPNVAKKDLFQNGYIASKSGHSRGSTIDLTLMDENGEELNMGGIYDFFDPISHTENQNVENVYLKNRRILKSLMKEAGFKNYSKEWWHYTLRDEPYPDKYFSFPVR